MSQVPPPLRLLLVDDEADFLAATARALTRRGFVVSTAPDAEVGLRLLETEAFDVAVLDVKMPGLSGDALFRKLKLLRPGMPVILLTGHGSVGQAFATSRDGVADYLTKPCDIDELAAVIRRAAGGRPQPVDTDEPLDNLRLLIVDDERELLASLRASLMRRQMRVFTAASSSEALALLDGQLFEVVLLDVKLPEVSGVDLLRHIKQVQPLAEVILLTGHPSVAASVESLKAGAFDYLPKPHDVEALAARIRAAARRHRAAAEQARDNKIETILTKG